MKIKTHYDPPPIPYRGCDWCATYDGYEPGEPIGYGATEREAVEALEESADFVQVDEDIAALSCRLCGGARVMDVGHGAATELVPCRHCNPDGVMP